MTSKRGARRGPASSAGRHLLGKVRKNATQGWKKALRRHPALGVVLSIALAVVGVLALTIGLLAENALYFLATALSGLGSLAVARARLLERQRQQQQAARRPTVSKPAARPHPGRPPAAEPEQPAGPVRCTETGKLAAECGCASRHVTSSDGVTFFGRPLGTPLGRRNKTPGTTKTPAA